MVIGTGNTSRQYRRDGLERFKSHDLMRLDSDFKGI